MMKQAQMPNIGHMLLSRAESHPDLVVLAYKNLGEDSYDTLSWRQFVADIQRCMYFFLEQGAVPGQRVAVFSPNCRQMLVTEMAIMSLGLVSVPLFAGYKQKMINELIRFAEVDFLVVADSVRLGMIYRELWPSCIIQFEPLSDTQVNVPVTAFEDLLARTLKSEEITCCEIACHKVNRDTQALLMFTSGTMGFPKGVQLTHGNILSQQEALAQMWPSFRGKSLLSYLPWHHSFGGIFERFFALYSCAILALDDSGGKDMARLMQNWAHISPHAFFSVPKIFVELISRLQVQPELEDRFLDGLEFVFTAGAPLPSCVAETFQNHGVPVLEGWGLTETSPCCSLTRAHEGRHPGLVGKAIPGVDIKLSDEGELLVRGPNVMMGYFKNEEANHKVFTPDGWFKTGDLGEITQAGIRIDSRKDRIFKLQNAEKVNPTEIENSLLGRCRVLKHVLVFGRGLEHVSALVFPNKEALGNQSRIRDCTDPHSSRELGSCLHGCITDLNAAMRKKYEFIDTFIIVDQELEIERGELTPSLKLNPKTVFNNFYSYIRPLYEAQAEKPDDAIYVNLAETMPANVVV